jgi:signal transduction histidine kinase
VAALSLRRILLRSLTWCGIANVFAVIAVIAAEPAAVLPLTPAQQAWVAAHPRIRVGLDPAWPPFSTATESGGCVGIDPDLLRELGRRLGLTFEFGTRPTWTEVYDAATQGGFDMLAATAVTGARRKDFVFTEPYLSFPVVIVTRNDEPLLWSVLDLVGRTVVGVRGYAPTSEIEREYPALRLVYVDTTEQALRQVADGGADAFISNLPNISFVAKTRGLTNLKIAGVLSEKFDLRYAVRPDWPELARLLDLAMASMTPGERQALVHPWIRVDYARVIRWDLVWKTGLSILAVLGVVLGAVLYHNRCLARELEERIRLHRQLEEAHDELVHLNEEKTELLQMAAHDLRGPLTGMQLVVDASLRLNAVPKTDALTLIETKVRQMTGLLSDLLDVEALEHGRREFQLALLDPAVMLHDAVAAQTVNAEHKQVRIELDLATDPLPLVHCDATALRQMVDNLLSNAIKFTPHNSTVRVHAEARDPLVRFEFHDQGPGVSPHETERIFVKYVRGTARPTGGEKSTGLGLSIVRQLAAAMNGRVWCESGRGGGYFVLVLPAATVAHLAVAHEPARRA